jgi:GNAT superfamily N-acetyltransferase
MERRTVLAMAAAAAARVAGANARVGLGVIGCGARGRYVARLMRDAGADVLAAADVYLPNAERLRAESGGACAVHQDFRKLLERRDVDAVLVATPDHWHAGAAVSACAAGKHVYLEKPFAYSIREGRAVVEAARRWKRILMPGTQHRSAEHFRECAELLRQAKERHYVYQDQPEISLVAARYPEEFETKVRLPDGNTILIRPIKPTDEPAMRELFYSFSRDTVFYRYFSYIKAMPHEKLSKFVNVDYEKEMALVAVIRKNGDEQIVGSTRYYVDPATGLAEFAIEVQDEYQNKGIGTALFNHLIRVARMKGVKGFVGYVLDSNTRAYRLVTKTGFPLETKWEDGVYILTLRFEK